MIRWQPHCGLAGPTRDPHTGQRGRTERDLFTSVIRGRRCLEDSNPADRMDGQSSSPDLAILEVWKRRQVNGASSRRFPGGAGTATGFAYTTRKFCTASNNGWMNRVDEEVRPILSSFARHEARTLSVAEQGALAIWTTKTVFGFFSRDFPARPVTAPVDPGSDAYRNWITVGLTARIETVPRDFVPICCTAPSAVGSDSWKLWVERRFATPVRSLNLLRKFMKRRFPAGFAFRLHVTRPLAIGKVRTVRMRTGKFPKMRQLCLVPGASRPSPCP